MRRVVRGAAGGSEHLLFAVVHLRLDLVDIPGRKANVCEKAASHDSDSGWPEGRRTARAVSTYFITAFDLFLFFRPKVLSTMAWSCAKEVEKK